MPDRLADCLFCPSQVTATREINTWAPFSILDTSVWLLDFQHVVVLLPTLNQSLVSSLLLATSPTTRRA